MIVQHKINHNSNKIKTVKIIFQGGRPPHWLCLCIKGEASGPSCCKTCSLLFSPRLLTDVEPPLIHNVKSSNPNSIPSFIPYSQVLLNFISSLASCITSFLSYSIGLSQWITSKQMLNFFSIEKYRSTLS